LFTDHLLIVFVIINKMGAIQGPTIPPLDGTDKNYEHVQNVPSTTWTIIHNLGKIPTITTYRDLAEGLVEMEGKVLHTDQSQSIVSFANAETGIAIAN
jgi:hypothetical protein